MKKNLTILTGLLLALTSNSQTINCKKFKEGTFYYPTLPNKISVRKDSIQESYNNGKLEMVWKVKWINECEYELTCQQVLVEPYSIKKNDKIVAKIVNTEEDCFTTTIIIYNEVNPNGQPIPSGQMCVKKE
jgi:hypothetical protein